MHRFFINSLEPTCIEGAENQHLTKVLRLRKGDMVELLDGASIFQARLEEIGKESSTATILSEMPKREASFRLCLYIGVLKGEKMDWVVQKATELGAYAVIPVIMERSVTHSGKLDRWERITKEAQKQCGRACSVHLQEPIPFVSAVEHMKHHAQLLVPYEGGGQALTMQMCAEQDLSLLIGPEGGISQDEIDRLIAAGAHIITLGARILRAETAAVAAMSAIMALSGEWGSKV